MVRYPWTHSLAFSFSLVVLVHSTTTASGSCCNRVERTDPLLLRPFSVQRKESVHVLRLKGAYASEQSEGEVQVCTLVRGMCNASGESEGSKGAQPEA
eukprot:3642348-Rhodomonas_salina.1